MGDRDINDVHRTEGLYAARAFHDAAQPFDGGGRGKPGGQPRRSIWHFHGDVEDEPLVEWLVADTLPKVGVGILGGWSGTFKTFVAVDLSRATITKTTFAGRRVMRQGATLLIAAEGANQFPLRINGVAREIAFGADAQPFEAERLPFAWAGECPRLADPDDYDLLIRDIKDGVREMRERFGMEVSLIVIDAMTSASGFADADKSSEAARVMDLLNRVAKEVEAFVLVIDHFGKDETRGLRNSVVKEDMSDVVLLTLCDQRPGVGVVAKNLRLAFAKLRGARSGEVIPFTTRLIEFTEFPPDEDGKRPTTKVIVWDEAPAAMSDAPRQGPPKSMRYFRDALAAAMGKNGVRIPPVEGEGDVMCVEREAVRREFIATYPADEPKAKDKAWTRCLMDSRNYGVNIREIDYHGQMTTFLWFSR
jgi:hypothetical protein